jgi:hypothetical protein
MTFDDQVSGRPFYPRNRFPGVVLSQEDAMGFFDFLRGAGKQVELKPETLKAEIGELGFNANAYEVLVEDATVTIRGMAGSQQEREKVILALGNVEGVEKVEDQIAIQARRHPARNQPGTG